VLQRLSNAVPLCKVVARPSFCSERPSNRSNQTQYHLVEKWTIPRQRHVFKRILHTCLPLHLVAWSPTKNLHPREALLHLGHQRIDCTWFRRAFYAFSFTFCDHPSQSSCLPGPSAHLSKSASWLRSENHNCPTAGISEQACLSQCLCSNILRQFKQSNCSSLPHDVEWRNIFSVMEHHSAVVVDTNKLNSISSYVKITDKIILDHGQQLAWRSNAAPVFLVRRWWGVNAQG